MKKSSTKSKCQNLFALGFKRLFAVVIAIAFVTLISGKSQGQNVYIPDTNFKAALINNGWVVADVNGNISYAEDATVTYIDVTGANISDMTGIAAFVNITDLYAGGTSVSTLDLSANTALVNLVMTTNTLTSINLASNVNLQYCDVSYNYLLSLNVGSNTALYYLDCSYNSLTVLNVSSNTT